MSKYYSHTIRENHASQRPSRVLFADIESNLEELPKGKTLFHPFLWTMIYHYFRRDTAKDTRSETWGTSIDTFWDAVEKHTYPRSKTYLVTHHLEVDFMPMKGITALPERGWELEHLICHNRVTILWYKKDNRTLLIMNNGNIFSGSIEQWGKTLGMNKLDMPAENEPLEKWVPYCMRDTQIVEQMWIFLLKFMDEHDLGNFKLTQAGLALTAYRHRFMNKKISIHKDPNLTLFERESYKGGHFEATQVGIFKDGPYYTLDINSMYGWIEENCELPYEFRGLQENPTLLDLRKRIKRYAVIAEVTLCVPNHWVPHKQGDKIHYLPGTFKTVLTTPELLYGMAQGWVVDVHRLAWYYKATVLQRFATYFLSLKDQYDKEDNQPLRQMTKLYLNALYGKFGQKGFEDRVIGTCNPEEFSFIDNYHFDTKTHSTILRYGGQIHQVLQTPAGPNTFVALASHITAYGRQMLYLLIEKAGRENVYHVATDSLVVNQTGLDRLADEIDSHAPGKLKIEKTYPDMIIRDVNDCTLGMVTKIKGIPRKAVQVGENSFTITVWPRLTTLLKQGEYDQYYTRSVTKTLQRTRFKQATQSTNSLQTLQER